jgi:hypothetical protein
MRASHLVASGLLAFAFACAGTSNFGADPLADSTPRAQGTIVLGATHSPGSSTISPSVSVSFVPDTASTTSFCGETTVGTCTITQAPDCTSLGCKAGETCGWDDSCNASCKPACTLSCGDGQTCKQDSGGNQSCVAVQTFDAGPIAVSGTNMPVSVYPPYGWKATDSGSPFSPGAELRATAAGPIGAGFTAFNETFHATTFLVASPSLDQLSLDDVFGDSDLSLGWVPGSDTLYVLASGAGGSARCVADDSSGAFTLPRDVITAILGAAKVPSMTLSIQRMRLERHQDARTTGSLDSETIDSRAWLDFATTSTETINLQACTSSQSACGAKCVDTDTDANNCGSCGNSCNGGSCYNGSCVAANNGTCSSCQASANASTCSSEYASCTGSCKSLLSCVMGCAGDSTCVSDCYNTYPSGQNAFDSYYSCLCGSACSSECQTECGG